MSQLVLLDLFCGAGGCARGYQQAGFYVVGVDIAPQPRYAGDEFYQMDALEYLATVGLSRFAAIHASPPCQAYSKARNLQGNEHPDMVGPVRAALQATGEPYIIENVPGAPLVDPVLLVGSMFGLRTMRPRLFECSGFDVPFVLAPPPAARHAKMGRPPQPGEYVHVVGHMSNVPYCREAMGIDWMVQGELAEAIPPAYTEFIGAHLIAALQTVTA
jgi:DNA (cytosine-5)-methyltransferase 1